MVEYKDDSIFNATEQIITNTVNCVGAMGKGLALEFKKRYPEMFEEYKKLCNEGKIEIGIPWKWNHILNFPTKIHWRNPSHIRYIESGLNWIKNSYKDLGMKSIALPKLGCGNGGLEWEQVKVLIEETFKDVNDLKVVVYTKQENAEKLRNDI